MNPLVVEIFRVRQAFFFHSFFLPAPGTQEEDPFAIVGDGRELVVVVIGHDQFFFLFFTVIDIDAGVVQDGSTLSLEIVVGIDISPKRARELGEGYVHLIKIYGPDTPPPGRQIGKGDYDYNIVVAYPNGRVVAQGTKDRSDTDVEW